MPMACMIGAKTWIWRSPVGPIGEAAVDHQRLPRYEFRAVAGEVERGFGDVFGQAGLGYGLRVLGGGRDG